jgi:thiamine kinase-like enzyme
MWHLGTTEGLFAVKQLSADLDANDPSTKKHFEATEAVAAEFLSKGIPAIGAIKGQGYYLHIVEDAGYLVYPWVEAKALHREAINSYHVEKVAQIFSEMHSAELNVPGLEDEGFSVMEEQNLITLVQFAHSRNSSRVAELESHLDRFREMISRHGQAVEHLCKRTVISHGDLDHKNVLWTHSDAPLVIDWESARWLNPTHEIVLEALDWSGITLDFNESLFDHLISSYLQAGGIGSFDEVEAALHCVLGDWLNWLMYNVGRSIDMQDAQQRRIGTEQLDHALSTLLRLERLLPRLLSKVN